LVHIVFIITRSVTKSFKSIFYVTGKRLRIVKAEQMADKPMCGVLNELYSFI